MVACGRKYVVLKNESMPTMYECLIKDICNSVDFLHDIKHTLTRALKKRLVLGSYVSVVQVLFLNSISYILAIWNLRCPEAAVSLFFSFSLATVIGCETSRFFSFSRQWITGFEFFSVGISTSWQWYS